MEIISAAYALPMTNGAPVVKNGAIAVELGKIFAFGKEDELKAEFPSAAVTVYSDHILLPGLVNAHCHLDLIEFEEALYADPEAGDTCPDFIDKVIASIEYKHEAEPQKVISGAQKGINRLIETGTTCVGGMTHFEGVFHILQEAGLRCVVFPEILAGRSEAAQTRFEIALALVEKYTDSAQNRIRVGLGPYAPYLLSRNLLRIISRHALHAGIQLQIHAAESFAEMEFFFDSQGPIATELFPTLGWADLPPAQHKTPVQYLSEISFLDAPSCIVGGLHLSANDFPLLRRHLSRVVYCPTTNQKMGHGNFPYGKLSEFGIPMGLGTDCWASKKGFSLWDEMRAALSSGSTPLPSPKEALQMATIGGARCLALDHLVGTLEAGRKADYIIIRAPKFDSDNDCYAKLINETGPQHVERVVVDGNVLKAT